MGSDPSSVGATSHRGAPTGRMRVNTGVPRVLVFMEAREFGGPAKNLAATSKLLAGSVDFTVVTFIRGGAPNTEFTEQLREHGVACQVIRERFRYDPRGLTAMLKIVRSHRPDIIQIHNSKSRLYLYALRKTRLVRHVRIIDCYHGETWTDTKQLAYNKLDRWLFRRAENIIVVSQKQVQLLSEFGVPAERVTVIYNGIRPRAASHRPPNEPLRIITVGRLSREKGHTNLLDAAKLLRHRGAPAFEVVVVGDGPEIESLKSRVRNENLADIVELTGYQSDPSPHYETADIFVLPSLTEGIPNVLLEAAMHDVAIVSTDVGGVPEMFEDSHEALLVPPNDVGLLADAIERCLVDRRLRERLAQTARAKVERQFTEDHRAQQYLEFYNKLIRRSG